MRMRQYPAGELIFQEGDPSDLAFIIRTGRVEIFKGEGSQAMRLAVLGVGDIFGEMGLIDERPRSASARAIEPVAATAVDRQEFLDMLLRRPQDAMGLLRTLFERLRMANQALIARGATPAVRRGMLRVLLRPLTPEAGVAMPADGIAVDRFPFRVGRRPTPGESDLLSMNEVLLTDRPPHHLSLNHFAIDLDGGAAVVRDRGSRQGTIVNGKEIGARGLHDVAPLREGHNDLTAGLPDSPFRFAIEVRQEAS